MSKSDSKESDLLFKNAGVEEFRIITDSKSWRPKR